MEIVYEIIMRKCEKIRNAFFSTLKDANYFYHTYHSSGWEGDIYRREF